MIGMVLVTHGALADEFRAALEHVVGTQENIASICIGADDNMEKRRQDIVDAIGEVDKWCRRRFTDRYVWRHAIKFSNFSFGKNRVEVIAGINLPMLIKLASIRDSTALAEAVMEAKQAAQKYISVASEVLARPPATE